MSHSPFGLILYSLFLFLVANSLKLSTKKSTTLIPSFLSKNNDKETTATAKTFKIPLRKLEMSEAHKKKFYDFVSESQSELYTNFLLKSEKTDETSSSIRKISLLNFQNIQFVGDIAIGAKGNTFKVIFDTGSANIWINSKECQDRGCLNHKQYDGDLSRNYKSTGHTLDVEFGTGKLHGIIARDNFFLEDIEVKGQYFAEIEKEDGEVFFESKFDGIVGMAFPVMSAMQMTPLFDNLMKQNDLKNNIFSFYFNKKEGEYDSQLILGGVDSDLHKGNINYNEVIDEFYWTINMEKILINGEDAGVCDNCKAIIDTGTSLITGPKQNLRALLNKLNVDRSCKNVEKLPKITFLIGGVNYDLEYQDYIIKIDSDSETCYASFMSLDIENEHGPAWILGDIFLTKYFSVFDRDASRIGFALAK